MRVEDVGHGQAFETAISRSSRPSASPESIDLLRERDALLEILGRAGDDERGRGVEQRDVAERSLLALEHVGSAAAFASASPPRNGFGLGACDGPTSSGVISNVVTVPFSSAATLVGPDGRDLVEPVRAVHHLGALGAEVLQHVGERLDPLAREHADHLPLARRPDWTAGRAG